MKEKLKSEFELKRTEEKKGVSNYFFLLITVFLFCQISCRQKQVVFNEGDKPGAYSSGIYRNLFLEIGHTQEEIDVKIDGAFRQLFYGDTSQRLYFEAGKNSNGPLACLYDVLHRDVRSEGMSYGMMICIQLDKKKEFDALWNWAMTYMYVTDPEHPNKGYFSWSLKTDGTPNAETPAPDGEEYFVTALYFAANRWGNGSGIYNYKAYADSILTNMRHRPFKSGKTISGRAAIGPMVNEEATMILFVPDSGFNDFTDPSYHLPAFYELWALWGPENDRKFWASAADTSRKFFQKTCHPITGLSPDYANFDGTPHFIVWNPNSVNFSFDSWRTASNWAVDWSWWKKDTGEIMLSNRIQNFFSTGGINTFSSRFTLNGEIIDSLHRIGLVSTAAVVSLAATNAHSAEFVEELWNSSVPSLFDQRYYDGTLYLLNLLHCSGNYRIWKPV